MLGKQQAPNSGTARLCAITGRGVDEDGWYTNHQVLTGFDPVAWVSHAGARMLAQSIGYRSPEEFELAVQAMEMLRSQLDAAVDEIRELRLQVAGIEGLAAAGFELSRKTGRPPKTTEKPVIEAELKQKAGATT
jgi:hypothetical protein